MTTLARTALCFFGLLLVAAGVLGGIAHREGALSWPLALSYVAGGALVIWEAVVARAEHVRSLLRTSPRLRWGTALAAPSLLLLAGARLAGWELPGAAKGLLLGGLVVGLFVLFFDL